ncbi:MAG TPA: DUF1592 domain-containing protein, partial [Gemmataceae bacterium]|nr:DUF1592 domain-containing protein [Gemmataceae bacterium]
CVTCHGPEKQRAKIRLDKYEIEADVLKDRPVFERVAKAVRNRDMPPRFRMTQQPTTAEREQLSAWLDAALGAVDCKLARDPGRVTIRRLNRTEYNNTIRDLVGVRFQPAEDFPADDVGYGFDNIGDVLTLPPLLMEKYLAAAERIIEETFNTPELKKKLVGDAPPADAKPRVKLEAGRKVLSEFARQAFRRSLAKVEVERFVSLIELADKNGDSYEKGLQLALEAVLVSPHFLFRIELDKEPNNPDALHPVNDFELATRLSYFLWSSMPDDELLRLAEQGGLRKDDNLAKQVRRMLRDPKASALVENFAGQWLQLRNLKTAAPDPETYPAFDDALRAAMVKETELFFETVMREDRSILEFIDAEYTFVNERLAKHYGIAGVKGEEFRRVSLAGGARGGVLTQASILTLTSNPTRTSPVKRGKWILENLLGTPPPPPPPNVPELKDDKEVVLSGSLRQRMEQHRTKPDCAVCHAKLDPLGFGFENFDGIGSWRDKDGRFEIDSSGVLPDGKQFKGPAELRTILIGRAPEFRHCLSEKMLTYSLGRGLEYYDKCAVDEIAASTAKEQDRFSALVLAVVQSEPFQNRRGKRTDK